jgi:MFS family permease
MTALTAGLLIMAQIDARGSFASEILLGSLLIGIGMGTAWTAMFIGATSGVEPNEQGVASGLVNSSLQIGGAIGLAVLVGIVTSQTRHSSGTVEVATTHALHVAYYVAAAFAAAGAFVAWRLKGRTVRREISTAELPRNVCVGSPAAEPAAVISASGPTN